MDLTVIKIGNNDPLLIYNNNNDQWIKATLGITG